MKFLNLLPLCVALFSLNVGVNATAAPFEIEENFDDSSLFPDGQNLPDGWSEQSAYHFRRLSGADTGQQTYSGSYMFGVTNTNNNDVFYTAPMECAAGEPFTIEFMAKILGKQPGGIPNPALKIYAGPTQNFEEMTLLATTERAIITEWTRFKYEYVPETDGEYCFAIQTHHPNGMNMLGPVYFDDFYFCGTTPEEAPGQELVPNPDNLADCVELPYLEEFDGQNYDGTTYVPLKWLTVGDNIWLTANIASLKAKSGSYYLIAPDSDQERNQRLYTPFFNMQQGVEYTMTFYTHFEGTYISSADAWLSTSMDVTVGTEQDGDFHPVTLATISRNKDNAGDWTAETIRFTPETSGPYCFCFRLSGPPYSGFVAMDDFFITSPNDIPRPMPDFSMMATFSWIDNSAFTSEATPIRLFNSSRYSDELNWDFNGLEHNLLPDGSADVFFTQTGRHTLKLSGTNQKGSRTTIKEYDVTVINEDLTRLPLLSYDPGAVTYYERGEIPCFDTDPDGLDYVSGFNHYYRSLAEKYLLPADVDFTVTDISIWLTNMRYVPVPDGGKLQSDELFSVAFYGADAEGNLDENRLLGRHTAQMGATFGTTGIGGMAESRVITLDTPVKISGTVYVAFEFSDNLQIDVYDPNIGRSFFSMGMLRHQHEQTSLFGKMTDAPENSTVVPDGSWYPVDALHPAAKGFGLNIQVWADATRDRSSVAINNAGLAVFGVKCDGGMLTVSGTSEGEYIAIYDLAGRQAIVAPAKEGSTTVDCTGLADGTYIVSTNSGAAKFIR